MKRTKRISGYRLTGKRGKWALRHWQTTPRAERAFEARLLAQVRGWFTAELHRQLGYAADYRRSDKRHAASRALNQAAYLRRERFRLQTVSTNE